MQSTRRTFLTTSAALTLAPLAKTAVPREPGVKLKLALNAYSFDKPLMAHAMTLEDVVHFCAQQRVDALDATGYYLIPKPLPTSMFTT